MKTSEDFKNRTETGQTNAAGGVVRAARTHQDYWKPRLKLRRYRDRDGQVVTVPEWQVRMFHRGREAWFNLETVNQTAAAAKARDIFLSLVAAGWPATLAKFKPSAPIRASVSRIAAELNNAALNKKLEEMTQRVPTRQRPRLAEVLAPYTEKLLKLHGLGWTYRQLAEELRANGLPVSIGSLREHLSTRGRGRRRGGRSAGKTAGAGAARTAP